MKIEKNIPIPERKNWKPKYSIFDQLTDGDSVLLEDEKKAFRFYSRLNNYCRTKKPDHKAIKRELRVWIIKKEQ